MNLFAPRTLVASVAAIGSLLFAITAPLAALESTDHPEKRAPSLNEYERCSDHPGVDHRILAGAKGPEPEAPFTYTRYYPEKLQIHRGDVVEWCFNGGYDFHDVQFIPADMDAKKHPKSKSSARNHVIRWDESGTLAFEEDWLLGYERNGNDQCGRTRWMTLGPEDPCVLSDKSEWMGSNILDRLFGMGYPGAFAMKIDLPPGIYRYHCNLHSQMDGLIEVLPKKKPVRNPSETAIEADIMSDYRAAKKVFDRLSDPSRAYDPVTKEWVVHLGATTKDHGVSILQFLPSRLDIAPGDRVRYVGGTDEAHTVTFPGEGTQGSFTVNGSCRPHACDDGAQLAPHGFVGTAFSWGCDPDDSRSGAPFVPGSYIPPQVMEADPALPYGCLAGTTEISFSPHTAFAQPAPGNLVASSTTFHNSGVVMDADLPDWYRTWKANGPAQPAGSFPSEFDAVFPAAGTFKYICSLHEYMNGIVSVR